MRRRTVVASVSVVVTGGLAGCTDGGSPGAGVDTDTDDTEPTDSPTASADAAVDGPALGNAVTLQDSYAFEVTAHDQNVEVSGRYHQGDTYHDIRTAEQQRVESYLVDGTSYVRTSGVCLVDPDAGRNPASGIDFAMSDLDTYEGHVEGHASVSPAGTTTIDGEQVYVYEISTDGVEATYYVSRDTGLLRRYEQRGAQGEVTVEFHSWGAVDPIEPPAACAEAGDSTETSDSAEGPVFENAVTFRNSYAFEVTAHDQDFEVSGRYHQGDTYHDIRMTGQQRVESYLVDGTSYVVTSGVCLVNPRASQDPTSSVNTGATELDTYEGHVEGHASVRPAGTTTIDGEQVYVYEISTQGETATYYVSVETGLLRRYEQHGTESDVTIDYHSWGAVDPIEPPSNCRDV